MTIKAVLFDLDGTLLDSVGVWHQIDVAFLKKRGLELPNDYVRAVSMMHLHEAAEYTVARFHLCERPEDLVEEWRQMAHHAYSYDVPLKSGAKALLRRLKEKGYRLAVATALDRKLAEASLYHHEVYDLFDTIAYAADVGQGKSSPAVFLAAAASIGVLPQDCVVFEDTLAGVTSAKAAGMTVFAMEDAGSAADRAEIQVVADGYFTDFSDVFVDL